MREYIKAIKFRGLAILLLLLCLGIAAHAQTNSGVVLGRVVDQSGAVVPGASVKLTEQQTNVALTTKALSNGDFVFPVVQPGTYTITVEAPSFKQLVSNNLVLTSNERLSAG